MNWGHGITIFFSLFVVGMLSMVFYATSQKQELVTADYYTQELQFQKKIEEKRNAYALAEKPVFTVTNTELELAFPNAIAATSVMGSLYLFRHSNQKMDVQTPLQLNESNRQTISLAGLEKGVYQVQLSWQANNTDYYLEQEVYFN